MTKLEKYIKFILLKAVRLSRGDNLVIWCSEKQSNFALAVCDFAESFGADNTEIYYTDKALPAEVANIKFEHWKSNRYKLLWVYSDSCTVFPPLSWVTVNVATESWAKQVFPHLENSALAVEKLWDAIFSVCRIDDNDPVENWDMHIRALNEKADKLNRCNFQNLLFKSSTGTDLSVGLIGNHKWITCTATNHQGETVITNIPTEEVFTCPDTNSINGVVYATKPLLFNDEKVENFYLRFEDGIITDCGAEKNAHLLEQLLGCSKNSNRIGEIAIVPHSSPVSQLGLFWYDTSFDENTGCHLAFGNAYPQTLKGYSEKTSDELERLGFNVSAVHEDFVIGTPDMEITGITCDGKSVVIMKNGEWAI